MTQTYRCEDHEALVAFVYGECEPDAAEAIAAHLARCPSCAEELASLRSTRQALSAWTPPAAALGFRITQAEEPAPATVLRPAAWWRQPLPAWAQAAAAALIFAAGLTAGRNGVPAAAPAAPAAAPVAASAPPAPAAGVAAVSPDDLARIERRIGEVEAAQVRLASSRPAGGGVDERALMQRVEALIDASEERQWRQNVTMVAGVARDFELQRKYDLEKVGERLGYLHDTSEAVIDSLMRVSFQAAP